MYFDMDLETQTKCNVYTLTLVILSFLLTFLLLLSALFISKLRLVAAVSGWIFCSSRVLDVAIFGIEKLSDPGKQVSVSEVNRVPN